MYVTDVLGTVIDCYVGQVVDGGHTARLRVPTERYESCEEVE